MNLHVLQIQIGYFFKEKVTRPDELKDTVNNALSGLLDKAPLMLPLPEDFDENVPSVFLFSKDESIRCQIGKNRLDLFFNFKKPKTKYDSVIEVIENHSKQVFKKVNEKLKQNFINRVGLVVVVFIEESNAADFLQKKILKKNFGDLQEFILKINKKNSLLNFELNDLTTVTASTIKFGEEELKGFIFERDINNKPSNKKIEMALLDSFLDYMKNQVTEKGLDEILRD